MQKSKIKNKNYNLKFKNKRLLKDAIDFHGHLGPYLVLGILMGELAIKKLRCKKHFGIGAIVRGAIKKPVSCLIDGIQISTGCTYGKGNIEKKNGKTIQVLFKNLENNKGIRINLNKNLIVRLGHLNGHKESEAFARGLLKTNYINLFEVN